MKGNDSGLLLFLFLADKFLSAVLLADTQPRYAFVPGSLRKPFLMEMSRDTDLSRLESADKDPLLWPSVSPLLPQRRGNPRKIPNPIHSRPSSAPFAAARSAACLLTPT